LSPLYYVSLQHFYVLFLFFMFHFTPFLFIII
jgi:hypothetical protein